MKRTAIIMAGGSGERFWPLSRKSKPKQLLSLISNRTMLEESIARIAQVISTEEIYIVTSKILQKPIRETLTGILPAENIIAEPAKRNTAPCLALGAAFIAARHNSLKASEISISVLTADQLINPDIGFAQTISSILDYVENNDCLATIGITPTRPETGYGYIELTQLNDNIIQPVNAFYEKPNYEVACEYLKSRKYLWNSGMFFWRLDYFIDAMLKNSPEIGNKIEEMKSVYIGHTNLAIDGEHKPILKVFESFPNISIDYALMEKAANVVVARAQFEWDDVGSWDALQRVRNTDENGNILLGNNSIIDSKNTIVANFSSSKDLIVAGFGLEELVVIATDDAILICPKAQVQNVKETVQKIANDYGEKYL